MKFMHSLQLKSHVRTLSTLVVASIALPALAYADREDKDSRAENHGRGDTDEHHADRNIPVVPEANAGWVLVPFIGAVLLFSARKLFRESATE